MVPMQVTPEGAVAAAFPGPLAGQPVSGPSFGPMTDVQKADVGWRLAEMFPAMDPADYRPKPCELTVTTDNEFRDAARAGAEAVRNMAQLLDNLGRTRDDSEAFSKKLSRLAGMATELDRLAVYYGSLFDPEFASKRENVNKAFVLIGIASDAAAQLAGVINGGDSPFGTYDQSINAHRCVSVQETLSAIENELRTAARNIPS